jgi:EmrB/QacA subfamily drug resistance transporter
VRPGAAAAGPSAAVGGYGESRFGAEGLDQGHPRKWLILWVVALGMFMALLDSTIVNIAIPAVVTDLKTNISVVSWVLNAYNIGLAVFFLTFGRLADRYGQRLIFVMGIVMFGGFSLACGLAPSIGWLIIFRVGQALGAAAMVPVSLTILMSAFPRHQHGMATALWGVMGSVAAAVGPTLGGVLVQYASWHWIFYVNVPIAFITLAGTFWLIPEHKRAGEEAGVDLPGIVLSGAAFFALTLGLIQGNDWGWSSWRIVTLLVVAVVLLAAFGLWESKARSPMLNLRLFRIRSFVSATGAMFFIGTAVGGAIFLIVIYMVNVLGYSELKAAMGVTPMPAVGLILGPVIGKFMNKIGPSILAAVGGVLFAIGLFLMAQLGADSSIADIAWRIVIIGGGFTFTMPALTAAGMGSLPDRSRGVGSGVINTGRQFGFVMGVAILVAIFTSTIAGATTTAVAEAKTYVSSQSQIPDVAKQQIITAIDKAAAANAGGAGMGEGRRIDPLAGVPQATPGSPQAALQAQLGAALGKIFKTRIAGAFHWPFYAGAIMALLSIPFSVSIGRKIGQHREEHGGPATGERPPVAEG